ncbi:MAG: nucleotide exchange factor GrpE [Desulfatiglandaceae bacterium]
MVQAVMEKEEQKVKEVSLEESREQAEEGLEPEPRKEKETPLEKMTKAELLEKVKEAQELEEKNFDLYLRSQAEIENVKKRAQKEKTELAKFSNESLIKQLLPVADSLEKAIAHSEEGNSIDALREGVKLTLKGLMDTLKRAGLEEVKSVDEPFDPNFHEAVSEQEDSSVKPGTVTKELQKGYLLNERLIRPSMVVISKNKA